MNVGLYFGSFNPIHLGHTRLAQYIKDWAHLDEIWLVVSPNNPLKDATSLLDEQVRFHLAQLATQDIADIRPTDFEFQLTKPNYTYLTLRAFREAFPVHQFSLIMGSDNMTIFHLWKNYEELLQNYPILVYPREGDNLPELMARYPQMQVISGAPLFRISATEIREKLQAGESMQEWLHPNVADFLKKNAKLFADIKKKQ